MRLQVSGFCPSFGATSRWHSGRNRNRAEGVFACANRFLWACFLLGRCWLSLGVPIEPRHGATGAMGTATAMAIPRGSTAPTMHQGFTARASFAPECGVGVAGVIAAGVIVVGDGAVDGVGAAGAGDDGRLGEPSARCSRHIAPGACGERERDITWKV